LFFTWTGKAFPGARQRDHHLVLVGWRYGATTRTRSRCSPPAGPERGAGVVEPSDRNRDRFTRLEDARAERLGDGCGEGVPGALGFRFLTRLSALNVTHLAVHERETMRSLIDRLTVEGHVEVLDAETTAAGRPRAPCRRLGDRDAEHGCYSLAIFMMLLLGWSVRRR